MPLPARIRGFLFDLDGVVYVGENAIPGAGETLRTLKKRGLPCRFTTNTTTMSVTSLHRKLVGMDLPIERHELFTVIDAARSYLHSLGDPLCHFLLSDSPLSDFAEFRRSETKPDIVVVGDIGKRWTYDLMNRIFGMMIDGAELVALHKGRYWQVEDGLRMDIGAFVAGLEYTTGKSAIVIGKPSVRFFHLALAELALPSDQVIMVGDDIVNDIDGAQQAGISAVLVRTGKFREELVARSGVTPDATIDSIANLIALL